MTTTAFVTRVRTTLAGSVRRVGKRIPLARIRDRVRHDRRGTALILSMLLTVALAGIATSAIYLGGNATILSISMDRERDFKYASEAALAMGKSRINYDALAVPDTGYTQLLTDATISGADGKPIPNVTVNMYVGPTGPMTGQFGRFVSVVTEARDTRGARFVRRLELTQESFAKFAYWTDLESNNGSTIWFQNGDQLWGPVWSNDVINVSNTNGSPTFWSNVGTAQYINGKSQGIFKQGYQENQRAITLPNNGSLSKMPGYASAGSLSFTSSYTGDVSGLTTRMEFVTADIDGNGVIDPSEGFLKVYVINAAGSAAWLRGDWSNRQYNCGAWYNISATERRFFPIFLHSQSWMKTFLSGTGKTYNPVLNANANDLYNRLTRSKASYTAADQEMAVMQYTGTGQCFLGGAPELAGSERWGNAAYSAANTAAAAAGTQYKLYGGRDTTFTPTGNYGSWKNWTGTVDASVAAARRDGAQLFPLYRGLNTGTKGVVYIAGSVGVSGSIKAHVTLYSSASIGILDDLKYAADPSTTNCADILGMIAGKNIMIADNALNGPQALSDGVYHNYDDTQDMFIQSVIMALNTSFGAENYSTGPTDANDCEGKTVGRGCIYLLGGLIQDSRGAVGTSLSNGTATGYVKRYSYDRCALYNPPPYFPTTGRYTDNRYYEIDPQSFNVASLFASLTPSH